MARGYRIIGGPGAPGILIAKKNLFTNKIPNNCGGGTVNFVTRTQIEYIKDIETLEEGGTPDILGSIRAGLVFHLKESVGHYFIALREDELVKKVFQRFKNHKTLRVLGSSSVSRLAIFSFLIYVRQFKKFLHHHFICVLLNDLFGIQIRSGCSCAGPYVLDLLGISDEIAEIYTKFTTEDDDNQLNSIPKNALMKSGFTRFNLSYFSSDEEIDYILNAIEFIANFGWMYLPLYTYNPENTTWYPRDTRSNNKLSRLHSVRMITYEKGTMEVNMAIEENTRFNSNICQSIITSNSNDPIEQGKSMVENIPKYIYDNVDNISPDPKLNVPNEYKHLIWFVTPRQIIRKIVHEF